MVPDSSLTFFESSGEYIRMMENIKSTVVLDLGVDIVHHFFTDDGIQCLMDTSSKFIITHQTN